MDENHKRVLGSRAVESYLFSSLIVVRLATPML
jgi:hypothetical protein